jgi:hypothetical protein
MYGTSLCAVSLSLSRWVQFRFFTGEDGKEGVVEEGNDLLPFFITSLLK